jgi:YVTN family beta-propeller protein
LKRVWLLGALCIVNLVGPSLALSATPTSMKLYVAGTGGSDVYVVDVATNTVIKTLNVGKQPHGIAATPDGRWVWIATEGDGKIHKIDAVHDIVAATYALGPYQQEMEITDNGRMLYTGRFMDGCYDVFDTVKEKVIAHLPVDGSPHNVVKAAKDDRFMYLAPMNLSPTGGDSDVAAKYAIARGVLRDCDGKPKAAYVTNDKIYVADARANTIVGTIPVGGAPRPIVASDDGKRLYADIDGLLGFVVIDVAARKVVERVKFLLVTDDERTTFSRAHGIGITPDQKEVWTNSVNHGVVYAYDRTVEPVRLIARIPVGASPYWIAFSPDNRFGYIALAEADAIAVIDVTTHKLLKTISLPKNSGPKTIQVVAVPAG